MGKPIPINLRWLPLPDNVTILKEYPQMLPDAVRVGVPSAYDGYLLSHLRRGESATPLLQDFSDGVEGVLPATPGASR